MTGADKLAERVIRALADRGQTVGTAESLTGGLVVAGLTSVPGSSIVVRGGVCAYDAQVKHNVVGVRAESLASGAVNPAVARELAAGARALFRCDWGIGTTGVAGPDPSADAGVGTVHVAVAGPGAVGAHRPLQLAGDRTTIRASTVREALTLLNELLSSGAEPPLLD